MNRRSDPEVELTARLSAMARASELVDDANDLGIEAHVTGWDDDRIALDAEVFSMLLDAYRATGSGQSSRPAELAG
jgi:hypothetical protein